MPRRIFPGKGCYPLDPPSSCWAEIAAITTAEDGIDGPEQAITSVVTGAEYRLLVTAHTLLSVSKTQSAGTTDSRFQGAAATLSKLPVSVTSVWNTPGRDAYRR